jgi:hypothetical protein
MKRNWTPFALVVLLAATLVANGAMRTWNLESGTTLEAEIIAFPTPDSVLVKRADGKTFTLPTAYLAPTDRAFLEAERARQWKEVTIEKILGSVARYTKCSVSGKDVPKEILISKLPPNVETVLASKQRQETQITNLTSRIRSDLSAAKDAKGAAARTPNRAARNADRADARLASRDEVEAKAGLDKAKSDYADYLKKSKSDLTLRMRNTGTTYQNLAVWECQPPQKRP